MVKRPRFKFKGKSNGKVTGEYECFSATLIIPLDLTLSHSKKSLLFIKIPFFLKQIFAKNSLFILRSGITKSKIRISITAIANNIIILFFRLDSPKRFTCLNT